MHCSQDVLLGGLAQGVLHVIGEHDHVAVRKAVVFYEEVGHISHVLNATHQLTALSKVIDPDKQRLLLRDIGALPEMDRAGVAMAKRLEARLERRRRRRRWWSWWRGI